MATTYILESGDPYIRRRTEKGWTLDFIFNKDGYDWADGSTFYYWGISGETDASYYADNNLSFSFTEDGRIMWKAIHYKVDNTTTPIYYTLTGQTEIMCTGGTENDFNITITFERNKELEECDLLNVGGINDLISEVTIPLDNQDFLTGGTITTTTIQQLSPKWYHNRKSRLGKLKIYLNGQKFYELKNWEEIIPSERESENDLVQVIGGGTDGIDDLHIGETLFAILNFEYTEEPLNALAIKKKYKLLKSDYNITECNSCDDSPFNYTDPPTPTPTPTVTPTLTPQPTATPTPFPTSTPTATPTIAPTATPTPTPLPTSTPVPTNTPLPTATPVPTATPTVTPTPTPLPTINWVRYNSGVGVDAYEACTNYSNSNITHVYLTKSPTLYTVGDSVASDNTGTPFDGYCVINSKWVYVINGIVDSLDLCSSLPTPTPTPTPYPFLTPPPSGFTFNADYIVVTYAFTDGADLDTRTRISNPDIGQNDLSTYIGWNRSNEFPVGSGTPILKWAGDNTGTGFESVLIDLIQFKAQFPQFSGSTITIDMNAMWFGSLGSNPVVMDVMMYKGGSMSLDENAFLFINNTYTGIYGVASTGTSVTLVSQNGEDQQLVATLQYNLSNYNGNFI